MSQKHGFGIRVNLASEVTICDKSAILYGIYPGVVTTGTITVRSGPPAATGTVEHVLPIGTLVAGVTFGPEGVFMPEGLTITATVGTSDLPYVVYRPA